MKAASKHRVEKITPEEAKDVEQSFREIRAGKAKTVKSVDQLIQELKAD